MGPPAADGSYPQSDGCSSLRAVTTIFTSGINALYELIDPNTAMYGKRPRRILHARHGPEPATRGNGAPGPPITSAAARRHPMASRDQSQLDDTYRFFLGGQYFVLDGGDGQPAIPRARTSSASRSTRPTRRCQRECPRATDGFWHRRAAMRLLSSVRELRYDNNVGEVLIPSLHIPGKTGVGTAINDPSRMAQTGRVGADRRH